MAPADFCGKWKMTSSENFDKYMEYLGVNMVTRKLANASTFVVDISMDGDTVTLTTATTFKSHTIKFKDGEAFDDDALDGRKTTTTITLEGNTMVQSQKDKKGVIDTTITRELKGDEFIATATATGTDIVSRRVFKKQ